MRKKPNADLSKTLEQKMPALLALFAENSSALGVWLFGSQAEVTADLERGIVFGVLFKQRPLAQERHHLESVIARTLAVRVKIIDLRRAKLSVRFRALAGKLLYEDDYVRVSDFIERLLIEYPDYEWFRRRFEEDYAEGLRQEREQRDWSNLAAKEFFNGYADSDAIYK